MQLAAKCMRLRAKNDQCERLKNNIMFKDTQKAFQSKHRDQQALTVKALPPKEEIPKLCAGIFSNEKEHNSKSGWIEIERKL